MLLKRPEKDAESGFGLFIRRTIYSIDSWDTRVFDFKLVRSLSSLFTARKRSEQIIDTTKVFLGTVIIKFMGAVLRVFFILLQFRSAPQTTNVDGME